MLTRNWAGEGLLKPKADHGHGKKRPKDDSRKQRITDPGIRVMMQTMAGHHRGDNWISIGRGGGADHAPHIDLIVHSWNCCGVSDKVSEKS